MVGFNKRLKGCVLSFNGNCNCHLPCDRTRGLLRLSSIKGHTPFTFTGCEGNLEFALRMRFMRDLPVIDSELWAELDAYLDQTVLNFKNLNPLYINRKNLWSRWLKRYDPVKKGRMLAAKDDPLNTTDASQFRSGACVKYEIGTMSDKPLKPRAFFPKSDYNLSINGPLMYFIKSKINKIFDGQSTPFIFGSGKTTVSLGKCFEQGISKFDGKPLVSIELDLSMCETTMRGPFLVLEKFVYRALGLTNKECDYLLKHTTSFGSSGKRNLKFNMSFCRESGTANTTIGNTIVFASVLWSVMRYHGIDDRDWLALIGGDDCCVYCEKALIPKFKLVVEMVTGLGLKPEVLYHENQYAGRFYSGRMMQFYDPVNERIRFVHTPLIGRCLAKNNCVKYEGSKNPLTWLRDVTIARNYEWGHIPILRECNKGNLENFSQIKGKRKIPLPYREIESSKVLLTPARCTYEQLMAVYSCTEEDLESAMDYVEDVFAKPTWFGLELDHPIISKMCEIDLK